MHKKHINIIILFIILIFTITACNNNEPLISSQNSLQGNEQINSEEETNDVQSKDKQNSLQEEDHINSEEETNDVQDKNYDFINQTLTFPVSDKGKTEFNAFVYEIDPFDTNFILPNQWILKERELQMQEELEFHYLSTGAWSVLDIYNSMGECVGAIGYNIYEPYEGEEDNPQVIYSQIGLGNSYQFNVREDYTPVKITDTLTTAVTNVYYSETFMENYGFDRAEKVNKGILSYNEEHLIYIAIEFENDILGEEQILKIAESIDFNFK